MIHAGVGADVAMARFGYHHWIRANQAARLFQNYFHLPGIFLLPRTNGLSLRRRLDCCKLDDSTFGLRNYFLRDHEDVAILKTQTCFAGGIGYLFGEIVAAANLGQSGQANQAHIGACSPSLLCRWAGCETLGHVRGREILRDPAKAFTCKTPAFKKPEWCA